MRIEDIATARNEAVRFIERADRLLDAEEALRQEMTAKGRSYWTQPIDGSKLSGAVKRSSMDLTRALADMRNPYRAD